MLINLLVGAGVCTLALSSGYANYVHVEPLGITIIGLVIGAEIFKFAAPMAMAEHVKNESYTRFTGTFVVWGLVVVFSFLNTFGNALMRHATEQARIDLERDSAMRPVHLILKDIAAIPACNKRTGKNCGDEFGAKRKALEAEAVASRKSPPKEQKAIAKGDPIRDGMVQLAAMAGYEIKKDKVFTFVTLMWTMLAEVGSAVGALAFIRSKENKT